MSDTREKAKGFAFVDDVTGIAVNTVSATSRGVLVNLMRLTNPKGEQDPALWPEDDLLEAYRSQYARKGEVRAIKVTEA